MDLDRCGIEALKLNRIPFSAVYSIECLAVKPLCIKEVHAKASLLVRGEENLNLSVSDFRMLYKV